MNKHPLDKIILRDLFWFIVLPHRFKVWLKEKTVNEKIKSPEKVKL